MTSPSLSAGSTPGFVRETTPSSYSDSSSDVPNSRGTSLFPDATAMKEHMREQMTKPEYDVTIFYKTSGFCQRIARNSWFEKTTLAVIAANAIWIAVDTDYNNAEVLLVARPIFQITEHFFCMYFLFEWTMRFGAFHVKCNCRKDAWFVFDSLLVALMVMETWVMTAFLIMMGGGSGGGLGNASILRIARLLRLTRMARMARLLRAMPELLILIKGMVAAMRSVFFTLTLLILIIYVFGIAFTQLCADAECKEIFTGVFASMNVLLIQGALMDDLVEVVYPLKEEGLAFLMVFYVFLLLAALTIMNMLIGVICEVVSAVASTEREQMNLAEVREKIQELMTVGDSDYDNMISKDEFFKMLTNKKAAGILSGVGVDVFSLVDFAHYFFAGSDGDNETKLTFADLMNLVLDLRGSNTATVKDVVDLRRFVNLRFAEIQQLLTNRPPSCMFNNSSPNCSTDGLQAEPQSDVNEFLAAPALKQGSLASLLPLSNGQPLEAIDGSMNFKHLVDSSLSLLLSAHERELAAIKAENGCLQALCRTAVSGTRDGLKDQAPLAGLAKPRTSASEHVGVVAACKEGHISENSHSCTSDLGVAQTVGLAATGSVWEPPAVPLESDSRKAASASWSPSTRVVPLATGGSVTDEQSELVYIGVPAASYKL